MGKNTPLDKRLIGIWRSAEYHISTCEGWVFHEAVEPDEITYWEFREDGIVFEWPEAKPGAIVVCRYTPSTEELYVMHGYSPFWPSPLEQRYRVEVISDTELWLYALDDRPINRPIISTACRSTCSPAACFSAATCAGSTCPCCAFRLKVSRSALSFSANGTAALFR